MAAKNLGADRERYYGVYPAVVIDIEDPEEEGRVKIRLPWSSGSKGRGVGIWARLATLMAGSGRGTWFIPEVGDEVLAGFESGDLERPYVIGAMWNHQDRPPLSIDQGGKNNVKRIQSRNGIKVSLDDSSGEEQLILETPGGQTLLLKDGPGAVTITDSNGNAMKLEASGITIDTSAKVTVNGSHLEISAGMVTVNAGLSKFKGVVQADTVITNSVISASYTPGAGNIW